MLTNTSGINVLTGYQEQLDVSNTIRSSNIKNSSPLNRKEIDDTVNISRKTRKIQQVYEGTKESLEQDYNYDAQQLEKEYLQEKKRLEREFTQKKQSQNKSMETQFYLYFQMIE